MHRAEAAGFARAFVDTGGFRILTYSRLGNPAATIHVYVEGDGRAFLSRSRPSPDPTPRNPLALELALLDPAPSVLYIARPCQFLDANALASCQPRYWTTARYSEAVVEATDAVIDRVRQGANGRIGLIGHSGGGAIAALLAARRTDVDWLITVAGNLDHATWTRHHRVTPLTESLNPVDYAAALRPIRQLHLAGGEDTVVPAAIIESYLARLGNPETAKLGIYPDYGHDCCWQEIWPALVGAMEIAPTSP
jgi:pimeloyl-ACP methyl ester carboxylesterase